MWQLAVGRFRRDWLPRLLVTCWENTAVWRQAFRPASLPREALDIWRALLWDSYYPLWKINPHVTLSFLELLYNMDRGTGNRCSWCLPSTTQAFPRGTTTTSVRKRSRSSERKKVVSSPHSRHKRPHSRSRRKAAMRDSGVAHVTKAVFGPTSAPNGQVRDQRCTKLEVQFISLGASICYGMSELKGTAVQPVIVEVKTAVPSW